MKTLQIGIADYDRMKARTIAIARGEHKPAKGEPTSGSRPSRALRKCCPNATASFWL